MIAVFATCAAVFTLSLSLFPASGSSVYIAYAAMLAVLACARTCLGASMVQFLILAATLLLSDLLIAAVTQSWWLFAALFSGSCAIAIAVLFARAGRRAAMTQGGLVAILFLLLEMRYFIDPGYETTIARSLTLLIAAGSVAGWVLGLAALPLLSRRRQRSSAAYGRFESRPTKTKHRADSPRRPAVRRRR